MGCFVSKGTWETERSARDQAERWARQAEGRATNAEGRATYAENQLAYQTGYIEGVWDTVNGQLRIPYYEKSSSRRFIGYDE